MKSWHNERQKKGDWSNEDRSLGGGHHDNYEEVMTDTRLILGERKNWSNLRGTWSVLVREWSGIWPALAHEQFINTLTVVLKERDSVIHGPMWTSAGRIISDTYMYSIVVYSHHWFFVSMELQSFPNTGRYELTVSICNCTRNICYRLWQIILLMDVPMSNDMSSASACRCHLWSNQVLCSYLPADGYIC